MKLSAYEIIIEPVISEKATILQEQNKYVFYVHKKANKNEIKKALKELYNVDAVSCNIVNLKGKRKRVRYNFGYTPDKKKAIVTLKKGQKLDFIGQV